MWLVKTTAGAGRDFISPRHSGSIPGVVIMSKTIPRDSEKLFFMHHKAKPGEGRCYCWLSRWWLYDEESESVVFYRFPDKTLSPLCNRDKRFAEAIRDQSYPWAKVKKFAMIVANTEVA